MSRRPSISDLDHHLGYWLRYVSNHVSHAFSRKIEAKGVTVAEWVVLRQLYDHEAMLPSTLAEELGMTRGAISKLAERLVAKSLIVRTFSDYDRRFQNLALTASGQALVPELAALADQNDAEFFGHLAAEERKMIEEMMRDIVNRRGLKTLPTG